MKLTNSFGVPVGVEQAWPVLLDVERIAPCLPGASLDSAEADEYTGRVTIKAGPVVVSYSGRLRLREVDEDTHRVVLDAQGKEQRGSGTVKAVIAAQLLPAPDGTSLVTIDTELAITGKPAQLGRGLIADVSAKIIDQFATNLAKELTGPPQSVVASASGAEQSSDAAEHLVPAPPAAVPTTSSPPAAGSIDLVDVFGPQLRVAAVGVGLIGLLVLLSRLFKR